LEKNNHTYGQKNKEINMKKIIQQFIKTTNAFDVEAALVLFADDAVIDDVSVGEKFKNKAGVRKYIEKFFVGYHTVTRLESLKVVNDQHARAQVDFTGDFGHETGSLNVTINSAGLITAIDAYLD
jgi:ketosteroid isomerase-like protein